MPSSSQISGLSNLVTAIHSYESHVSRDDSKREPLLVRSKLYEESRRLDKKTRDGERTPVTRIKVKSNHARSKALVIGGGQVVLQFDNQGIATMPAHFLPVLQAEMRARPGRLQIVSDEPEVEEVAPSIVSALTNLVKTLKEKEQEEKQDRKESQKLTSQEAQEPSTQEKPVQAQAVQAQAVQAQAAKPAQVKRKVSKKKASKKKTSNTPRENE